MTRHSGRSWTAAPITEQATEIAHQVYDQKEQEIDSDLLRDAERQIMLRAVDHRWVRHLTDLDRLREGIGLQAIAQVDPLVAYKREAFAMYQELMNDIRSDIMKTIMTLQVQKAPTLPTPIARNIQTNRQDISNRKRFATPTTAPSATTPAGVGAARSIRPAT